MAPDPDKQECNYKLGHFIRWPDSQWHSKPRGTKGLLPVSRHAAKSTLGKSFDTRDPDILTSIHMWMDEHVGGGSRLDEEWFGLLPYCQKCRRTVAFLSTLTLTIWVKRQLLLANRPLYRSVHSMSRPSKYQEPSEPGTIDHQGLGKAFGVVFEVCMKKPSSKSEP